jgi:NADPH2:quinone reductase
VTKARVVSLTELGSADVIKVIDKELPAPAKGEVQIRQTAIGLMYTSAQVFIPWSCLLV